MVAQGKTSRSDRARMEWKGRKLTSYRPNYLIDEEAEDQENQECAKSHKII